MKKKMKELDLGHDNINQLLIAFAVPCIISMLINSIYNIVDQIFIGQGVGYVGNAATNVIFPLVILCNSIAGLLGNGCAAGLSLKLGEGKKDEARRQVGGTITLTIIISIIVSVIAYVSLPMLIQFFGCTKKVYPYAISYGRIIVCGAPFMIIYSALSSVIRADGSPRYSMMCLLIGAIINLILDPIFIFTFHMGVRGGALATIIGQIISCIVAILYIPKIKSVDLEKNDFIPDNSIIKTLGYGTSSFITQMTILVLFVYMNNIMTRFGMSSKFGADIPLSVYGVISKLNGLYVSSVIGIAIGAQPILGFNYGASNYDRVKQVLKKVLMINFGIGFVFNLIMVLFPTTVVSIFGSANDPLYLEFATDFCRIFLMLSVLNAFEMSCSIVIQSLGNPKKATFVAFARQIILFIPISFLLTNWKGIYGTLYAAPIADVICFILVFFVYRSEYRKIGNDKDYKSYTLKNSVRKNNPFKEKVIIVINREYGSGGRYVARLLADSLGLPFHDKDFVLKAAKESGYTEEYIETHEQKRNYGTQFHYEYNADDKLFQIESKVIQEISKESCIIVGRCADYVLKDEKNVIKIFLYSDDSHKVDRGIKYYGLSQNNALKEIKKVNRERAKHYQYYTGRKWNDISHYDLAFHTDTLGVEKTADIIKDYILKKFD